MITIIRIRRPYGLEPYHKHGEQVAASVSWIVGLKCDVGGILIESSAGARGR